MAKPGVKPKEDITKEVIGKIIGRNNTFVSYEEVEKLSAFGCTIGEIARYFGVNEDTLMNNFRDAFELGKVNLKLKLRRAMIENAIENKISQVQIFLAKNLLGMSDNPVNTEANSPLPWNTETQTSVDNDTE